MSLSTHLRRALLYAVEAHLDLVPGSSQKMLTKSRNLSIDSVIYDLEDSVATESKELARGLVADHIAADAMQRSVRGPKEVAVRINAVDTGLALQDIQASVDNLDTIVVPKVQSTADLHFVADVIRHVAPQRVLFRSPMTESSQQRKNAPRSRPIHVIGLIESALGLANASSICHAGQRLGLVRLGFAAEDFMANVELSKLPDRREVLFARSAVVNACRGHNLPSIIDMVSIDVDHGTILEEESREGRSLGFTGKQAIHPSQVEAIQRAFGPSTEEVQWAVEVFVGDIESQKQGRGAWKLNGSMIDAPVVKTATALLDRARACGIDVDTHLARCKVAVKQSLNPFDEQSVEDAVRLQEHRQSVEEIVAVSAGPPKCQDVLGTAISMGAGRLHGALGSCKAASGRGKRGKVKPGSLGQATQASKIEIEEDSDMVTRGIDGGTQTVEAQLSMVVTINLRLNEPRYATLPSIMKAKKKKIEQRTLEDDGVKDGKLL
ncbi:related to citrate lyase beta subunit [Fusarium proliferatum]|nr:related to citrate lyase beta subunit [Fusarium proliferatum]